MIQQVPANTEAEQSLLGSVLIEPSVVVDVSPIVSAQNFHDPFHGQLFAALQTLQQAGQPIGDMVALRQQLTELGVDWDVSYMAKLIGTVPTAAHAVHYAQTVSQLSRRRKLIDLAAEMRLRAKDESQPLDDITGYARRFIELLETGSKRNMPRAMPSVMSDLVNELRRDDGGSVVPTGFPEIDETLGMLQPSELTTIGARPGGGKTTFSMQLALHNANAGRRVLYVSLEMGELEFAKRLACIVLEIDSRALRYGRCHDSFVERISRLANGWVKDEMPFLLWAPPRATISEIESRARYQHAAGGIDLLVVDHLQIVGHSDKRLERYQKLGEITACLKALAKELSIPVICQSQLSRSESRPALSSLRESGDIEQNSDSVWFLHREPEASTSEFIVAKFRHGQPVQMDLFFEQGKFYDKQTHPSTVFDTEAQEQTDD